MRIWVLLGAASLAGCSDPPRGAGGGTPTLRPDDLQSSMQIDLVPAGGACAAPGDCASGFCAPEGVCCDAACTGTCTACTAGKTGQSDGTCAPVLASTATPCAPAICANGALSGGVCKGPVGCPMNVPSCCSPTTLASCAPYVCDPSSTACLIACATDTDCVSGWYCTAGGSCQPHLDDGAPCAAGSQCVSGNCVDGVCCDQLCAGTCETCATGNCSLVAAGADPRGDCPAQGAASCERSGGCDGAGACRLFAPGTPCSADACVGGSRVVYACDATHVCAAAVTPCDPYPCSQGVCGTSCAGPADCSTSAFCDPVAHVCHATLGSGQPAARRISARRAGAPTAAAVTTPARASARRAASSASRECASRSTAIRGMGARRAPPRRPATRARRGDATGAIPRSARATWARR